ncbi:DUF1349 domain-containing protein [Luedemannella flava]
MIVSVVTRGTSDDANSIVLDGRTTWLRVCRLGPAYAFHTSTDGRRWSLIRVFTLGDDDLPTQVGFLAQSPTGAGARSRSTTSASAPSAWRTCAPATEAGPPDTAVSSSCRSSRRAGRGRPCRSR